MNKTPWLVRFFSCLFDFLGKASVAFLLRKIFPLACHDIVVDVWVIISLLIPLGFLLCSSPQSLSIPLGFLFGFGAFQLFSIIIVHINVIIFDELRAKAKRKDDAVQSYRRSLILVAFNYVEIIFWFALAYNIISDIDSVCTSLHLSFVTMTNFGKQPVELQGCIQNIVPIQSAMGFFMLVLILAYFVSLIPRRKSKDPLEQ